MLGLKLREEFQGDYLKGTAIELATNNQDGATQIAAGKFLEITYPMRSRWKTLFTLFRDRNTPRFDYVQGQEE